MMIAFTFSFFAMKKIFLFPVLGVCSLFLLAWCSKQSIPQAPAPQPSEAAQPSQPTPDEQPVPSTGTNNTTGTNTASNGPNIPENQKTINGKIIRLGTNTVDVEYINVDKVLTGENAPMSHAQYTALSVEQQLAYSNRITEVMKKAPSDTIKVNVDQKTEFFNIVLWKPAEWTWASLPPLWQGSFNDLKQWGQINIIWELQWENIKAMKIFILPEIPAEQW